MVEALAFDTSRMTLPYVKQTRAKYGQHGSAVGAVAALRSWALVAAIVATGLLAAQPTPARAEVADSRPYDEKLMRLAEILGAMHYLRELCSANEGLLWREKMKELLDADGGSALRRARLTRSFNQGYRSYRRTYVSCTATAQGSITRFLAEGVQISDTLVKNAP